MKKKLLALILAGAAACSIFAFAGCGSGDGGDQNNNGGQTEKPDNNQGGGQTHSHTFDKQITQEKYLKSAATCVKKAVYYYSCGCGEKGTETFEYGGLGEHRFKDGKCEVCNAVETTQGLEYTLNEECTEYSVTGIGTATATKIVIADKYNGKPVTSIGENAFAGVEMESVAIPDSVKIIGQSAFANCKQLLSITIPQGVTEIGLAAFYGCNFTELNIPDNVETIGQQAFWGCKLTSLTLGKGITKISLQAFGNCFGLTSVVIPKGIKSMGQSVFYGCSKLKIYCEEESEPEQGWDGWNILKVNISGSNVTPVYIETVWGYNSEN